MSCPITSGRKDGCKKYIGGVKAIYASEFKDGNYVFANGEVTAIDAGLTEVFKYELKPDGNSWTSEGVSDKNTGTTIYNESFATVLTGLDKDTSLQVDLFMKGYQHLVVEDYMGNFYLLGTLEGISVTASTITTGGAHTDFSGYNLTFTGVSAIPAPKLDSATVIALEAIVSATNIQP